MKKRPLSDYAIFAGIVFVILAYLWVSLPKQKSNQPKFIEESSDYRLFEAHMIKAEEEILGVKYRGRKIVNGQEKMVWEDTSNIK